MASYFEAVYNRLILALWRGDAEEIDPLTLIWMERMTFYDILEEGKADSMILPTASLEKPITDDKRLVKHRLKFPKHEYDVSIFLLVASDVLPHQLEHAMLDLNRKTITGTKELYREIPIKYFTSQECCQGTASPNLGTTGLLERSIRASWATAASGWSA